MTASIVLGESLELDVEGYDAAADDAFWPAFDAAVRAAHAHPAAAQLRVVRQFAAMRPESKVTRALLARLHTHFDRMHRDGASTRALCAAADLFAGLPSLPAAGSLPLRQLAFLVDAAAAIAAKQPLPACADVDPAQADAAAFRWVPVTSAWKPGEVRGDRLVKGRISGATPLAAAAGPVYFEVDFPKAARVVIGVGTKAHAANKAALGEDAHSIGFDGWSLFTGGDCPRHGWAIPRAGQSALGCTIDAAKRTVRFNIDGEFFDVVPFPAAWGDAPEVFPFAQASATAEGTLLRCTAEQCQFRQAQVAALRASDESAAASYDKAKRSNVPPIDLATYAAIARHMGDPKEHALPGGMIPAAAEPYKRHIDVLQRCVLRAWPLVDPTDPTSATGAAIGSLKQALTKPFRDEHLCVVRPVTERKNRRALPQVTIRWFDLFSKRPRPAAEALQKSVLGQLYRQVGSDGAFFEQTPMFFTSLMMTDSGHVPIDAGGPYNQVWALLAEEIMTGDGVKPDFHRNPLFRFVTNAKGTSVVPDPARASGFELAHFRLLGCIMGHMARANAVLALELSPFVWKFLVDDQLSAETYLNDVEPYLRKVLDDPERLAADDADTLIPGLSKHFEQLRATAAYARMPDELARRAAAEQALVKSMDPALSAMRAGLWQTLGARAVKAMTWRDLELKVCGVPYPTWEQFVASVKCGLPQEHADRFWAAMKGMTPQEWGDFFYFAAAQKRYPLTRKISVSPSGSSTAHIPVASTCFASVTIPPYATSEEYAKKIRVAISCKDMELA